jgi:predicted glycoside hydrolase/deacetylase ChbG (UPF0249 family)
MQKTTKIIINADDLGWSEHRDRGIFELYERGKLTSATALANGYNIEPALARAREIGMHVGLHLNLSEGPLVSLPESS